MTEFGRLLRDAAGDPPWPLMMDAIRERAGRRRLRRRVALGLVGLGALAGLGGPTGVSLLPAGDRPAGVETVGIDQDRHQPTPTALVNRPAHDRTSAVPGRSDSPPVGDTGAPTPRASTDVMPDAPFGPGADRASSCWVDNVDSGDRTVRSGDSVRCRFTAAAVGGWNVYQERGSTSPLESEIVTAVVHVTRNGVTVTYRTKEVATDSGSRTEGCADGVIQPGDLVEVVLSETEDTTPLDLSPDEGVAVGAGEGWGCSDPGQPSWATSNDGST